jgi:dTDP-4-amino-4,6-dideoxygalactose transaminase
MGVPLLDLKPQHEPLQAELASKAAHVLKSGQFVFGPEVTAFEEEVAAYCGCAHAVGLSSGTDALLVAMMAMGIGEGDEVLCPSFTFFGTAGSIVRLGAVPVWVDVLPDTYNIDLADALDKVTERTKAIVPVHLFGQAAEMECVQAFAKRFQLRVIEDAAQAIGAIYKGKRVCSWGDCGALSFYPTKNLGGFGDGGMLVTSDRELAERFIHLRNHGMNPKYFHSVVGGNFRLDALQAALLRVKLPHLDDYHAGRRAHAEVYLKELKGHGLLHLPRIVPQAVSVWNQFTVRVIERKRDAFREHMKAKGIGTEVYYPLGLHDQECFAGIGKGGESLTVTPVLAREVVSLPCFPEMTEGQRQEVIEAVWAFGYSQSS